MTDMTVQDVARICGVTERTVRRWLREGRLPATRLAGRVRIPRHAVQELAAPYGVPGAALDPHAPGPHAPGGDDWWEALRDPARLEAVDARRIERAVALMDQARAMAGRAEQGADDASLVRRVEMSRTRAGTPGSDDPRRERDRAWFLSDEPMPTERSRSGDTHCPDPNVGSSLRSAGPR